MRSFSFAPVTTVAVILAFASNSFTLAGYSQSLELQAFLANVQISTFQSASLPSSSTDRAALKSAVVAGNFTARPDYSRTACPVSCRDSGVESNAWFTYNSARRVERCGEPMLLSFALNNSLDDPETHVKISACTADWSLDDGTTAAANTTRVSGHT